MRKFFWVYFILLINCTEPIGFDPRTDAEYLIVDGFISNGTGPYEVYLGRSASYSSALNGGNEQPITGAELWIRDDSGDHVDLHESEKGVYATPEAFLGEIGKSYSLHIKTPDGREYQSIPETLLAPDEISGAHYEFVVLKTLILNGNITRTYGVRFYLDSEFEVSDSYHRWDWEATYIKRTTLYPEDSALRDDSLLEFCYVDERSLDQVNIQGQTTGVQGRLIAENEIDFRFNYKYSMNLLQYTMTREAYDYWKLIQDQKENTGSVFDTPPANVLGNIVNVTGSEEIVLGRFDVYGSSSQRFFIANHDLPVQGQISDLTCDRDAPADFCWDCALFPGSRPHKPDFWEG